MFVQPIIQSCIVFIFLTIFFYTYVASIEREEFENQLHKIVDDIFNEYRDNITNSFPEDENKKEVSKTAIYGFIDYKEYDIKKKSKSQNDNIDKSNKVIIINSIYLILFYIGCCILSLIILYYSGYTIDIKNSLKEGIFILIFIFIVEFTFLNLIAKNYISGNANYVTQTISEKVIEYIDQRK